MSAIKHRDAALQQDAVSLYAIDTDNDGKQNYFDNCPNHYNPQ
jgi:hypothetical protein